MDNLIAVVDKWPDVCEIRQQDDDEKTREVVFIVKRRNSHPVHDGLKLMLQLLENKGVRVRVRVADVDLTLEQFERHGAFAAGGMMSKTAHNKQGLYNLRSQLNKLLSEAVALPEDSPQYALTARRVSHLRAMLATIEPDLPVSDEALRKSNEALEHLAKIMREEEIQYAERKPDVAGQVLVDEGEDQTLLGSAALSPKLESD